MQSETLAQEFSRLVKEYHEGDDHTKPEAWNLLADFSVDNADAISAALAEQKQQGVEVKPLDWRPEPPYHVARIFGNLYAVEAWDGGVTLSGMGGRRDFSTVAEAKAAAYADYKDRVLALVDVPAVEQEPVALIEREVLAELRKHWSATGTVCNPLFKSKFGDKVPLFVHPPRSLSNEEKAVPADLLERCKEIVEWKQTGKLPGDHLRNLGETIEESLGGSLFIDAGLNQAELQTTDEALKFIIALTRPASHQADGSAPSTSGGSE